MESYYWLSYYLIPRYFGNGQFQRLHNPTRRSCDIISEENAQWGRSSERIWKTAMDLSAVPVKTRLSTTFQQSRFPSGDTVGYLVN
jgi:hypothetical protein